MLESSLNKTSEACNLIKKVSTTSAFIWTLGSFENISYAKHLRMAASVPTLTETTWIACNCLCDFTRLETLKYSVVPNTAFLFSCGDCVRGLFLCTALWIVKKYLFNVYQFFA